MPIRKGKISFTLDLTEEIKSVPKERRKDVTELIGITVIDSIGEYLDRNISPVAKGEFKKTLSKSYKAKTGKNAADLQLKGDMLSALGFDNTATKVTFKITDTKQKKKAYNHNVGDTLPVRQFIPDDFKGETFKRSITKRIKEIIEDES